MKYICKCCNYSTENKGNYYKHNKSVKHITNSNKPCNLNGIPTATPPYSHQKPPIISNKVIPQKVNQSDDSKYKCTYCSSTFSRNDSLSRHLRRCKERENKHNLLENEFEKYKIIKEKEIEFRNKEMDLHNKELDIIKKEENIKLRTELEKLRAELELMKQKEHIYENSIENIKSQYENHIDTLKNENRFQKHLIESAGGMIKKSMNTMSYLLLNYNEAPKLAPLSNYSIISKDTETLINDLIHYNKKGNFEKYIGDFIIKQYKKDNPDLQSLWSSDIERLNYFVRELINNKNSDLDNSIQNDSKNAKINWTVDKKGIKVKKFIIDPLLDYIKTIGAKYLQEKNALINHLDTNEATELLMNMQEIGIINSGILNKSLSENINKYIAPYFYLNK
ncbi:C2H2-type zinc finger [Catovirus CTV1]|uniref:C2H2-type zinc finger n=1 Tax=Catovirus CTV1 TaxID=1977631 RepID=A0A1V0SC34_9VIRU|nr:C2H2-type zinc finger [Catovirus CTV1]